MVKHQIICQQFSISYLLKMVIFGFVGHFLGRFGGYFMSRQVNVDRSVKILNQTTSSAHLTISEDK